MNPSYSWQPLGALLVAKGLLTENQLQWALSEQQRTGRLVGEYIAKQKPKRWAIAGRNREKLDALGFGVPIIVVDAMDPAACAAVAKRTRVVGMPWFRPPCYQFVGKRRN